VRHEPVTGELFLRDPYLREFDARVVGIAGREVWLEQTAFYPGGGGQPHDKGTLKVGPVQARVVDVQRRDGGIVHVTDTPIPDTVGHLVGELDWERRYAHMRQQTALHVFSAVLWRDFGAQVTGGKLYAGRTRADFSFPGEFTAGVMEEVELAANREVLEGRPVIVYELSPEAAARKGALIQARESLVTGETDSVRVVEIEGLGARADGGTHVADTTEIGEMRITNHESKPRGGERVEFALQSRR